jgi:hypothetical protein
VENKMLTRAAIMIATFLMAIPFVPVNATTPATVALTPSSITSDFGTTFTASIVLSGASNVLAYDVRILLNPDVFTINSASLSGTLLDPATHGNVQVLRQQVFPTVGIARFALVTVGPSCGATPNSSASLLNLQITVNDPTDPSSIATASEYPASISMTSEIAGTDASCLAVNTIPSTASGASFDPTTAGISDIALNNVGCRATNGGFNILAKGLTDPVFCRISNIGTKSINELSSFSYRSIGGVTGSVASDIAILTPGQSSQQTSAITVPNANDIFAVTGQPARVISFNDGTALFLPAASSTFKIVVNTGL